MRLVAEAGEELGGEGMVDDGRLHGRHDCRPWIAPTLACATSTTRSCGPRRRTPTSSPCARRPTDLGVAAVCVSPSRLPLPDGARSAPGSRVAAVCGFPSGAHHAGRQGGRGGGRRRRRRRPRSTWSSTSGGPRPATGPPSRRSCRSCGRRSPPLVLLKVIIESALLDTIGIVAASAGVRRAADAGADFVKTSTGFHPAGGATVDAVSLHGRHGRAPARGEGVGRHPDGRRRARHGRRRRHSARLLGARGHPRRAAVACDATCHATTPTPPSRSGGAEGAAPRPPRRRRSAPPPSSSSPRRTGYDGLPTTDPDELAAWFTAGADRGDLVLYLEGFAHTVGVMQTREALERVAAECATDLADDGVVYAEVRFAPELHLEAGLTLDEVVESVLAGFRAGSAGRPITIGLLLSAPCARRRTRPTSPTSSCATATPASSGSTSPGASRAHPPTRHLDAFRHIAEANHHITIHAGEAFGLPSIWEALQLCGAERLGHGVRIVDDIEIGPDGKVVLGPAGHLRAGPAHAAGDVPDLERATPAQRRQPRRAPDRPPEAPAVPGDGQHRQPD